MSNVSFSINIPTDSDGYFNLCCPYCRNKFKILASEFKETAIVNIYCPICGLVDEFNSFYTDEVIDKAHSIAQNYVEDMIYQMFKGLERKNRGNKFVKIKTGKKPSTYEPELYETDNHLVIVEKKCCDSHFKVAELDKWLIPYCIYCGGK
ncbi:hypothetical protein CN894_11795 [Bacillus thuringiensis]|uniref:hypothetical protein n=1 Tax=Bacillus thuringiensis TaxID=1428 RepID=UPI000BFDF5AF|nr:hypothetical protein [Bacillus thuringiensis]PGH72160.1 hypothetical protein CN894_11795 [Bacillus thuringiensis]